MERVASLSPPALAAVMVLSWEHSAPPLRLHSSGLGEFAVALVVTALVPFIGFSLQAPDLVGVRVLLLAVAPLCCLQFAMLLASRMRSVTERWASAPWWCVSAPSARRDSTG